MKRLLPFSSAIFALLLAATYVLPAQGARVTGAIFTTTFDGAIVNANHYESKCDVYLDGGPGPNAPAKAAGLPNGDYYFQVTDPSGAQLLSTDPVSNRRFQVVGGVIVAYTGTGAPPHPIGIDQDHPELGAITIRLANNDCPTDYLNTPNNGGVYKVWATPVGDFSGNPANVDNNCGNGCFHGFVPSKSKTDNFKVVPTTSTFCLTIVKEEPTSGDENFCRVEEGYPVAGWLMTLSGPLGDLGNHFTDDTGQVQVCGLVAGMYTVTEDTPETHTLECLFVNGVEIAPGNPQPIYSFTWQAGNPEPVIVFRNLAAGPI